MIIIRDEKKPLACDQCWAFEAVNIRGQKKGLCLITNKLLNDIIYEDCPLEEVDDDER